MCVCVHKSSLLHAKGIDSYIDKSREGLIFDMFALMSLQLESEQTERTGKHSVDGQDIPTPGQTHLCSLHLNMLLSNITQVATKSRSLHYHSSTLCFHTD